MKKELLMTTAAAALSFGMAAPGAQASTVVASIFGLYDARCGVNTDCTLGTGHTAVLFRTGSGDGGFPQGYDTPSLFIDNPTAHTMTGVTLTLTGYQGLNNGKTSSISLPDIAPGTILDVDWANTLAKGDLFSFDYDDSYGRTQSNPNCTVGGVCALVGNFDLNFSATLNGGPIAAKFSPDNTQDGGNVAGKFVGWEGLDPTGLSETAFDAHNGTVSGPLAVITTGTTGGQHVPEPTSLALLGAGLGALGIVRRRRKTSV